MNGYIVTVGGTPVYACNDIEKCLKEASEKMRMAVLTPGCERKPISVVPAWIDLVPNIKVEGNTFGEGTWGELIRIDQFGGRVIMKDCYIITMEEARKRGLVDERGTDVLTNPEVDL